MHLRVLIDQAFSNFFAGVPLNEIKKYPCTTDFFFLHLNRKAEIGKLADSGDNFYNVGNNAAY